MASALPASEGLRRARPQAAEQSQGLDQVNLAATQTDQVTQQTANQAVDLSVTAKDISEAAQRLFDQVARSKVDAGAPSPATVARKAGIRAHA